MTLERVMPRAKFPLARGIGSGTPSGDRARRNGYLGALDRQERRSAILLAAPAAIVAIGVIVVPLFYAG
jgi:hypothetical protein